MQKSSDNNSNNNNNKNKKKGLDPKEPVAPSKIKKAKTVEGEEEEEKTSPPPVVQDNHSEDEVESVASDTESVESFYECNYCCNFGHQGCPCYNCGEDAGSYFIGRKLNDEEMDEAIEFMNMRSEEGEEEN